MVVSNITKLAATLGWRSSLYLNIQSCAAASNEVMILSQHILKGLICLKRRGHREDFITL
jgi:hypothetical protein